MKYVNVKIYSDFDVIVEIDKDIDNFGVGTEVIVQSKDALDYGTISKIYSNDEEFDIDDSYSFLRFANSNDMRIYKKNIIDAQKAFIKCRELIKKYDLPMKLIDSSYTYTRDMLLFKFYSDDRVDFRKLAKDLAKIYRTRIELRQVGVRDKAKEIGGCGQCGRELCCKRFLSEFNSVSINMAKNQNIALNPSKINGICGRLLCCLQYEDECYKECRKKLPKVGDTIETETRTGKVLSVDPLNMKYKILNDKNEAVVCVTYDSIK